MCLCAVVDTARYAVAALCKEERAHTHILQAEAKEIALHGPFRKTQERERRVQETKQHKRKKRNLPSKTVHCCAVAALDTDVRCSRSYEEGRREVDSGATNRWR